MMSKELGYIRVFQIIFYLGITILFSVSLINSISKEKQAAEKYAFIEAQASYNKDLLYRQWASEHGGVYVPVSKKTPPNPYLTFIDNRDISTPEKELTLVNPAYMTRQVFEIGQGQEGVWGNITSLNPIRPENAPDEWEKAALEKFEEGVHEHWSLENTPNGEYLRYMQAMITEKSCLKCHAGQGYKLNDIRGGISVSVPMKKYDEIRADHIKSEVASHAIFYFIILSFSTFGFKRFTNEFRKRNLVQEKLRESENGLQMQLKEYASLNEQYRKQNNELKLAKEKAEESDRLKSTFIQNMSHEVRTPMNAICGFSSMLNKPGISNDKIEKYTSLVQLSSHQLLNIINDLLTISAIESNEQLLLKDHFLIKELFKDLQTHFTNRKISSDIILEYQLHTKDDEVIYGDRDKIFEVMSQLIKNALKFTEKGKVTFGCHRNNNQLIFFVKDTGIGISNALKERIFDRFFQGVVSEEKLYGGNGLGLSIARALVELMHGSINVDSTPDEGSVFSFSIPYEKGENKNTTLVPQHASTGKTILVAEDVYTNFILLKHILQEEGYTVIHASNGKEAVEICNNNKNISIVLMDIKMPVMSGETAAKKIKENYPEMKIIAVSAYAMHHEVETYRNIFDAYLTKPVDKEVLIEKIDFFLTHNSD